MLKFKKLAITLSLIMLLGASALAATNVNVTINGDLVTFTDTGPIMVNDRVLVPLRGVFEKMGASVQWDAENKIVYINTETRDIVLPANSTIAKINGSDSYLDSPVLIISGRTMVPLRFVSEAIGATVTWHQSSSTVEIIK